MKLDHKIIGFFDVIRKKSILLKLQLPQIMKIDNVFHLNFFQKAFIDLLISQVNELALPVIINNEEKWEVEDIFNARSH